MSNDNRNIGGSKIDLDSAQLLIAAVDDITDLRTKYTALLADVTAIRTLLSAHVHGGVTAGAANTSALAAAPALTATAVATQTLTK
jgi:acyl-coenzyme A thioesterase PaaI-like protein